MRENWVVIESGLPGNVIEVCGPAPPRLKTFIDYEHRHIALLLGPAIHNALQVVRPLPVINRTLRR